jgi:hypothetical protein
LTPSPSKTSEVNTVQSTPTSKNQNKKKGKGKNKEEKSNNQQYDKPKNHPADDKEKRKPHYPCLICGEHHYTKDCPRHAEVTKFLQGTETPPTPAILSQPFLLSNKPNWLFMTNLIPLPHLMYLCVLVTPRRMKL